MRLAAAAAAALALLPILLLAGCSGPTAPPAGDPRAAVAALQWPTLSVHTTPSEPAERAGTNIVTWGAGTFAVYSQSEADLSRKSVVASGGAVYTTDNDVGWTRAEFGRSIRLSPRLILWDLQTVLADPGVHVEVRPEGDVLNATATGRMESRGWDVAVQLGAVAGRVTWAREEAQVGRESPFTFRAEGAAFPFPPVAPPAFRDESEVGALNDRARAAHVQVIQLIQAYARNHAGTVPDEPSPSSMALELAASGQPWPDNPFTDRPLAKGDGPGDFVWAKCGPFDALYGGRGFDSYLVSQTFRSSCT